MWLHRAIFVAVLCLAGPPTCHPVVQTCKPLAPSEEMLDRLTRVLARPRMQVGLTSHDRVERAGAAAASQATHSATLHSSVLTRIIPAGAWGSFSRLLKCVRGKDYSHHIQDGSEPATSHENGTGTREWNIVALARALNGTRTAPAWEYNQLLDTFWVEVDLQQPRAVAKGCHGHQSTSTSVIISAQGLYKVLDKVR
jgi:hypothetical protein